MLDTQQTEQLTNDKRITIKGKIKPTKDQLTMQEHTRKQVQYELTTQQRNKNVKLKDKKIDQQNN